MVGQVTGVPGNQPPHAMLQPPPPLPLQPVQQTLFAMPPPLPASSPAAAFAPSHQTQSGGASKKEYVLLVPTDDVKRIIGPKGANITRLREQAGCTIKIKDGDLPGGPEHPPGTICQSLHLSGADSNVDVALALVQALLATDPSETARGMVRHAPPAADATVYALGQEEQQLLAEIAYHQEQQQQLHYLLLQRSQRLQEVQQQLHHLRQAPTSKKRKTV